MAYYPIILVMMLAIVDWIAVEKHWKIVEYIFKTATMLTVLAWIYLATGWGGAMLWFTIGALLCLVGDIFLMLPRSSFIFGILAFLLGQMCYVIGFNTNPPYVSLWGIFIIILLGVYVGWLYPRIVGGLLEHGEAKLRIPVLVYSIGISAMVYSALMTWTRPGWSRMAALVASAGALLFYASDSILAWDRFLNPLPHGRLANMITYHLGQIGIILGAILFAGIK